MSDQSDLPLIDICLATYNGQEWLAEFLRSLELQTYRNWRLVVSDDGSTDETIAMVGSFFKQCSERLLMVERERRGAGVIENFQDALQASTADYIFLADQDDVWLPNKLMDLFLALREVETTGRLPASVYSDLGVVDQNLHRLSESWWTYSQVPATWCLSLRRLLVQNSVPGCAMIVNRRLLDVALPIPAEAVMHDWWLLLVASVMGRVAYFEARATVLYRRHGAALTYVEKDGLIAALKRFLLQGAALKAAYKASTLQAAALLRRVGARATAQTLEPVRRYVQSAARGWLGRRLSLLAGGVVKPTLKGTIRFYFWV